MTQYVLAFIPCNACHKARSTRLSGARNGLFTALTFVLCRYVSEQKGSLSSAFIAQLKDDCPGELMTAHTGTPLTYT